MFAIGEDGCRIILTCPKLNCIASQALMYKSDTHSTNAECIYLSVYTLYVSVNDISVMLGRFSVFIYLNSTKKQIK